MGVMSYQFQVLCPGTSCGNGNACGGATFYLTQKNADGLPKVTFSECGVVNEISDISEATTTSTTTNGTNQGREGPTTVATELGNSAGGETIGSKHHEISGEDVKHLSTGAVSGAIAVLLLLIAITACCVCRHRKRNTSNIRVSK